ncbi:hypothetical protein Lpp124_08473, partial [Lacticaseibacillus paracasei subsp. paracasei CNCM I-4649]
YENSSDKGDVDVQLKIFDSYFHLLIYNLYIHLWNYGKIFLQDQHTIIQKGFFTVRLVYDIY